MLTANLVGAPIWRCGGNEQLELLVEIALCAFLILVSHFPFFVFYEDGGGPNFG